MAHAPVNCSNTAHYVWGERCDGWHLVNNPSLSVIQERMPPGTAEVSHFHQRAQQFFFILSGRAILEIDGQERELQRGDGIHILAGAPHRIRNASAEPVEFLVVSQPHSHGDRVVVSPSATERSK